MKKLLALTFLAITWQLVPYPFMPLAQKHKPRRAGRPAGFQASAVRKAVSVKSVALTLAFA